MRNFLLLLPVVFCFKMNVAQTAVWSTDIAPILYNKCTACHHAGGLAPFSLMTYSETHAKMALVADAVNTGEMPPWPPDRTYNHYKDERFLDSTEINLINAWINGGAPSGDTALAPVAPVYGNGSTLSGINKVIQIPAFTVPNINHDLYQCFTVPTNLAQDEFVTAIEALPGDPSIVHHILIYEDTTSAELSAILDANTPEPGYPNFGGPGVPNADLVGSWVPGTVPNVYPAGMGVKIHRNSRLVIQIHYPTGSAGKVDSTKINLRLTTANLRQVYIGPALTHAGTMLDGPLVIPADSVKTFHEAFTIPANYPIPGVSVLSVLPHAHLLCKNWLVFATTPAGDTVPFVKINNWDFHWQGSYTFQKLLFIPKGSTLFGVATYDNTVNNLNNPSSPPQLVTVGESTTDEMMLSFFSFLLYIPGDENIVLDSTILQSTGIENVKGAESLVSTPQLYDAVPNPANEETVISYYLPATTKAELRIFDLSGKLVDVLTAPGAPGYNSIAYNTAKLSSGTYLYSLNVNGAVKSKQLMVTR